MNATGLFVSPCTLPCVFMCDVVSGSGAVDDAHRVPACRGYGVVLSGCGGGGLQLSRASLYLGGGFTRGFTTN